MSHHMCSTGLTRRLHLPGVDVVALFAGDGAKTMFAMAVDALIGTTVMEAVMRVDGNLLADFRSVTRILEIRLKVEALSRFGDGLFAVPSETSLDVGRRKLAVDVAEATELGPVKTSDPKGPYWRKKPTQVITFFQFPAEIRTLPGS